MSPGDSRSDASARHLVEELDAEGFLQIDGPFPTSTAAFDAAGALVNGCRLLRGLPAMRVVGDFVIPPVDGTASRDFQTLHFDFGLPLDPKVAQDVARYTALHVPAEIAAVHAVTRLVPLAALLGQRAWPPLPELLARLRSYGQTHGAWDDERGYTEGSLARIVEALAVSGPPILPSVKVEPGFLCGLEFTSLLSELSFFSRYGLRIGSVEIEIALEPGQLLIFDNLAFAHGREGTRQPGELRQRIFGHHLSPAEQIKVRDQVLTQFYTAQAEEVV